MKRDKVTPATSQALSSIHVPACTACNTNLNRKIEEPAKPVVRRFLMHRDSGDKIALSPHECEALSRWLLKVGLLSAHPDAHHDHPGVQQEHDVPRLPVVRPEWLNWMRDGHKPPTGFSVFITRRNLHSDPAEPSQQRHINLPRLIVNDEDCNFMSQSLGFADLNATFVWHPGWPITHAQVDSARAVRLWPDPYEFDFLALPRVPPNELVFRDGSSEVLDVSADQLPMLAQHPLSVDSGPAPAL